MHSIPPNFKLLYHNLARSRQLSNRRLLAAHTSDHGCCLRPCWVRVGDDFRPQGGADLVDGAFLPLVVAGGAQREEHKVILADTKLVQLGRGHGGDDVELVGELAAVGLQGQIIDVVSEGVLDFAADEGKAEDDVCGD